jgi:DNA-binding NarL/FixJ family response regulator
MAPAAERRRIASPPAAAGTAILATPPPQKTFNVLLLDDYALFRDSLVAVLRARAPWLAITVVETGAAAAALLAAERDAHDLVLVDAELGGIGDGVAAARRLARRFPTVPHGLLTDDRDGWSAADARAAGFVAVLPKALAPERMVAALAAIADGDTWF